MPRAYKVSSDHPAFDYLVRLHADLGGQIDASRKEAKRLAEATEHVEAVIRIFEPVYDVRRIAARRRNRKNKWFPRRDHGPRRVRRAQDDGGGLTAEGGLATREITLRVLAARGETEPS